jgi:hypothetical protein
LNPTSNQECGSILNEWMYLSARKGSMKNGEPDSRGADMMGHCLVLAGFCGMYVATTETDAFSAR